MHTAFAGLLMAPLFAAALGDGAFELRYRGHLAPVERDGAGEPVRRFETYCLTTAKGDGSRKLAFVVREEGSGDGWSWPERFDQMQLAAGNRPSNKARMQILHDLDGTPHPVALSRPLFEFADKLDAGAKWTEGQSTYEVTGSTKVGLRECWQIAVSTSFGRNQTLQVDKQDKLVVADQRRLTLGQGKPFLLTMELVSADAADAKRLALLEPPLETLLALKQNLKRAENETNPQLSDEQLKQAADVVEPLVKQAESTPFSALAATIAHDVSSQRKRGDELTKLAKAYVGQPAAQLDLKSLDGKALGAESNASKIVVLHFWNYNDDPLVEPYGQVGYLEFLHNRRGKLGVNVYGVAVDARLADDKSVGAARRDIRKLQQFMNLTYPIATDDGKVLPKFGDPRRVGARLPLWVVIDHDGKIAHYHAGFYDIKPDEGLKELDNVVVELIRKKRAAEPAK
ncbi:MAG: TlpA disulfide reductase family protein [Planctomycetaceae bacterium]